jgi:hypothetical protein
MTDITKLEYRVRKVERYIVTRYEERGPTGSVSERGEFANPDQAWETAYALCKIEHDFHLGWAPDDERVQYPRHPNADAEVVSIKAA